MIHSKRCSFSLIVASMLTVSAIAYAQVPLAPATAPTANRTLEQIMTDLGPAIEELNSSMDASVFTDAEKRAASGPKVLASLKKILTLGREMETVDESGKMIYGQIRGELLPLLALFADEESAVMIKEMAASPDAELATSAKTAVVMSGWWKSSTDPTAQLKIIPQAVELAKSNPTSDQIASALTTLARRGNASRELADQMAASVLDNMTAPFAEQFKQTWTALTALRARENKPLVVTGTTPDGKSFTTADWTGKVILVDFWAVWCLPCRAALPEVKQAYKDYRDKGLEIVGVSNDFDAEALKNFVSAEAGMTWPQLFDPKAAAQEKWNPISTGFGLEPVGIPTMFLIDKKGILRTVDAAENFKEMIPKLLAE